MDSAVVLYDHLKSSSRHSRMYMVFRVRDIAKMWKYVEMVIIVLTPSTGKGEWSLVQRALQISNFLNMLLSSKGRYISGVKVQIFQKLKNLQQNSFNPMSNNLKIQVIQRLMRVVPRPKFCSLP
jgi:hypothetical protein